jgi:hypothetical protein
MAKYERPEKYYIRYTVYSKPFIRKNAIYYYLADVTGSHTTGTKSVRVCQVNANTGELKEVKLGTATVKGHKIWSEQVLIEKTLKVYSWFNYMGAPSLPTSDPFYTDVQFYSEPPTQEEIEAMSFPLTLTE